MLKAAEVVEVSIEELIAKYQWVNISVIRCFRNPKIVKLLCITEWRHKILMQSEKIARMGFLSPNVF